MKQPWSRSAIVTNSIVNLIFTWISFFASAAIESLFDTSMQFKLRHYLTWDRFALLGSAE